jgi:hypothetical protein
MAAPTVRMQMPSVPKPMYWWAFAGGRSSMRQAGRPWMRRSSAVVYRRQRSTPGRQSKIQLVPVVKHAAGLSME